MARDEGKTDFHLSDAEARAVASGCKHSMLNPPERSVHYRPWHPLATARGSAFGPKQSL